ncbi:unnamed protein product, partial [Citrullus colocynthis]
EQHFQISYKYSYPINNKPYIPLNFQQIHRYKNFKMSYHLKSWPALVFMDANTVANIIKKEHPDFQIIKMMAGSPVTKDLKHGRVRLFTNVEEIVVEVPHEG